MINGSRNQSFGIDGYDIPMNQSYLEKPHQFMITKSKKGDYLSSIMKEKEKIPSPDKYSDMGSMIMRRNLSIYKRER